jgi:hypothetical protein
LRDDRANVSDVRFASDLTLEDTAQQAFRPELLTDRKRTARVQNGHSCRCAGAAWRRVHLAGRDASCLPGMVRNIARATDHDSGFDFGQLVVEWVPEADLLAGGLADRD